MNRTTKNMSHAFRFFSLMGIWMVFASGCGMSGHILDEALEQQRAGNRAQALALALEALDVSPDDSDAQALIATERDAVINEKSQKSKTLFEGKEPFKAMAELRGSLTLQRALARHNLSSSTEPAEAELKSMKEACGKEWLEKAQKSALDGEPEKAIESYMDVIAVSPSASAFEEIADSAYQLGEKHYGARKFREAIRSYEFSNRFVNKPDNAEKIKASRFELAQCYAAKRQLRLACLELEKLAALDPQFIPDETSLNAENKPMKSREWADLARVKATSRLAVSRLDAKPGAEPIIDGRNLPVLLQERVYSMLNSRKSDFLMLLREDTAAASLNAIEKSRMNEANPLTRKKVKFEVEDYIFKGDLTTANVQRPDPVINQKTGYLTLPTYAQQYNPQTGMNQMVVTGSIQHPFQFTEIQKSIEVALGFSTQVVEAQQNQTAASDSMSFREKDEVHYAENLLMNAPPQNTMLSLEQARSRIPSDVQNLFKARKELKSAGELIDPLIGSAAEAVTLGITKKLDATTDPRAMPEPCEGM